MSARSLYAVVESPYNKYNPNTKDTVSHLSWNLVETNKVAERIYNGYPDKDGDNVKKTECGGFYANFCYGGGAGVMTITVEKISVDSLWIINTVKAPLLKKFLVSSRVASTGKKPELLKELEKLLQNEAEKNQVVNSSQGNITSAATVADASPEMLEGSAAKKRKLESEQQNISNI